MMYTSNNTLTRIPLSLSRLGKKLNSRLHIFFGIWCALFSVFHPFPADAQNEFESDIESYRWQMQRLEKNILEQKDKAQESIRTERSILQDLEEIEVKLKKHEEKVEGLDVKVQLQQMLIDLKQEEIESLSTEREEVLHHLEKRSSAYYKMGKIGLLNVTFSSQSLPDLLRFHDSFQTLIAYDKDVIIKYRSSINALKRATDAEALELSLLNKFMAAAEAEKEHIELVRNEKNKLLTRIRSQKHLHEQATEEMEEASKQLSQKLLTLKTEQQGHEVTFLKKKGKLRVPVAGTVVTYFNQNKLNNLGVMRKSAGIAIATPDGSKVRAVAEGTVIFSGYLRGYGNTVIIHHGFEYYTVTSRLEKVIPKKGDPVKSGSYLGPSSDTATVIDEGLYFEIRHGKKSLNPLEWLNTRKLKMSKATSS